MATCSRSVGSPDSCGYCDAPMFTTLQDFIEALDRAGELHRVSVPVSSILECTEIVDRLSKSPSAARGSLSSIVTDPLHAGLGGHAVLFEDVVGPDGQPAAFPLAMNLFGSYRRLEIALGCETDGLEALSLRIGDLVKMKPPRSLAEFGALAGRMLPLLRVPPRTVKRGLCQQVVQTCSDVDLTTLPIIKCWPLDGDPEAVGFPVPGDQPDTSIGAGRFITFAGMYTVHADDAGEVKPASRNIGMYRAQLIDRQRLAMHWHMHHDGAAHWRSWKRAGHARMPVAIVFGGESVLPYAATAPLPPGISELLMAGFLNKGGIPLVRCRTIPMDVPANAEIVIEGWVSTEAGMVGYDSRATDEPLGPGAVFEGPFGDHTGFYSLPDRYPIMDVTAITHRQQAVYPATIVGLPPQEDYYLGKATERLFLPLLQTLVHDIIDYDLPLFGCFHNCAFIKIRKEYPLQARRVMHAIWGAGQMAWTKYIVVVDEDVNVHDHRDVMRSVMARCHFGRDLELANGPLDILDHAAPSLGAGCKMGIDATRKMAGEEVGGIPIGAAGDADSGTAIHVERLCQQFDDSVCKVVIPTFAPAGQAIFVQLTSDDRAAARRVLDQVVTRNRHGEGVAPACVFVVGPQCDVEDDEQVLFHWCANTDPGRDMVRSGCRIGFDATIKSALPSESGGGVRDFPPILTMRDDVRERVTQRWREYGLEGIE
ncbi:MAG: UbiD family decarboxylase [Planctomycetes bacterium]|nr:UbiD family decarboxylase [Planctomycetota bacterium]